VAIKHEIQDFVIATESVYRLLSGRKTDTLTCHEAAILQCCLDTLAMANGSSPGSTGVGLPPDLGRDERGPIRPTREDRDRSAEPASWSPAARHSIEGRSDHRHDHETGPAAEWR